MTTQTVTARRPATRLPATRERRPLLAVLAVLLILLGAAGAGYAALANGAKVQYIVLAHSVTQGSRIQVVDLRGVSLSGDTSKFVKASDQGTVVGTYAATGLAEGQPLVSGSFTTTTPLSQGNQQVTVTPLNVPTGLINGDTVELFRTATSGDSGAVDLGQATVVSITIPSGQTAASTGAQTKVSLSLAKSLSGPALAASAANALSMAKSAPATPTKKTK